MHRFGDGAGELQLFLDMIHTIMQGQDSVSAARSSGTDQRFDASCNPNYQVLSRFAGTVFTSRSSADPNYRQVSDPI